MEDSKRDPKQPREQANEARSLKTINHSGVKVKTNIRAGAGTNGLKTVNGP
jgi:hypothetical protein